MSALHCLFVREGCGCTEAGQVLSRSNRRASHHAYHTRHLHQFTIALRLRRKPQPAPSLAPAAQARSDLRAERAARLSMSARVSRMRRSNLRPRFTGTTHHLALSRLILFATWSQRRRCRAARYTAAARCDARCCGARGVHGVKVDLVAAVRAQRAARLELVPHQQLRREVRLPCLRGRPRARSCSARGGTGSILCAGPH